MNWERAVGYPRLARIVETILPCDQSFEGYIMDYEFPGIGRRKMIFNATVLLVMLVLSGDGGCHCQGITV